MEEKNESIFRRYKSDIIVISVILAFALLFILFFEVTKKEGAFVEVTQGGEVIGKYSLLSDGVYTLNGGTNELTIKDGAAYMTYSNCPDHTCENTGKIRHVGQTIICLPNDLTVTVVGVADDYVDFVS